MPLDAQAKRHDVVGLGNAIVDVLAHADDELIQRLGLVKGAMTLVDSERSDFLYGQLGQAQQVSGGSCANTMVAIASLGGKAAYIGRVRDDQLGELFAHDMRSTGVTFESRPSTSGPPTARSMIFVTDDAQRSMQTYLGACVELGPEDVDEALIAAADVVYLEGYLWDRPEAKAACRKAADIAHEAGGRLALTLSDPFCVGRWRQEFLALIEDQVEILFANEAEITSLYETDDFDAAAAEIRQVVDIAVLTRSERGSVIVTADEWHVIDAAPIAKLVDTTGAGDLYAAGFLRGLTGGLDLARCGQLGARAAASILEIYGPRAMRPLRPMFDELAAAQG